MPRRRPRWSAQGFDLPLLIGGATTSRVHTAVKIHPNYRRGQTVYVNDASRAVGVVGALMSRQNRDAYVAETRAEYARIAAAHARGEANKQRVALAEARANALKLDWQAFAPPRPTLPRHPGVRRLIRSPSWSRTSTGRRSSQTWELTGKFPAILDDAKVGEAARSLYADARAMLDKIISEDWFRASAVIGFWPANAVGDDIAIYADEARGKPLAVLHTLRQQLARREGRANTALADFVAPAGIADYVGAFVVTAGLGEDVVAERFKGANDDYSSILVKALADRLAEAFAERMHQRVRRELWGYAADEKLRTRPT